MDDVKELVDEERKENLQDQLNTANEEIQSLTQQLNCLLLLTKNAWRGDETATIHLARVIGVDSEVEQNAFVEKKITGRSSAKKTVKIVDNYDTTFKQTPSIESSSEENLHEQQQQQGHGQTAVRNTYLQPFLKQSHIDPIREQDSRRIFNDMIHYHQNEMRKSTIITSRNSQLNVRPRATKHLYRPASADHVVRHLGSSISRAKPYFVFAGKEFFQQKASYSPLYQKALVTSNRSRRRSQHSDISDESDVIAPPTAEPVIPRPQTAKSTQQLTTLRLGARSATLNGPPRASSALSSASSTKLSQLSERERRDAMRLQRQLNLPRQGWLNQHS